MAVDPLWDFVKGFKDVFYKDRSAIGLQLHHQKQKRQMLPIESTAVNPALR